MVKKRTKVSAAVFVMLAVALLLTISMSVAYATPSESISGKWAMTGGTLVDLRPAGNSDVGFVQINGLGFFTGGIFGPFTSEARWTGHNTGLPDMWSNGHVVITISPAKVMGKTGTLLFMFNGKQGEGGNWVIVGGTGALASLHGQGKWSPTGGFPQIAYEGRVHFDP